MSILPITWPDKIDDPSILAVLLETDPKTYISATEINQIKNALNELFNTPFSMTQDLINEITRATAAESSLNGRLITEQQQRIAADNSLESSVITEKNRASNAETALTVALENEKSLRISTNSANATAAAVEYSRNINAEQVLRADLVTEILRATNTDTTIVASVTAERNRATNVESAITLNLASEINRAQIKEEDLNDTINSEIARSIAADATFAANMRNETSNRESAVTTLNTSVITEKNRAETAELFGRNALIQETASRLAAFTLLSDRVSFIVANIDPANIDSLSELLNAYKNADSKLADAMTLLGTNLSNVIDVESRSRIAGQVVLTADIATEKTRATAAELKLSQDLVNETTRANAADLLLETEIDNEVVRATAAEKKITNDLATEKTRAISIENIKSPIDNPVFTGNGIQYPKLTTAQRDVVAFPERSLTIFNTDNNLIEVYNGTQWVSLSGHASVSSAVAFENIELNAVLVPGMKLTPAAGTYLATFNAQFDTVMSNITGQANQNLQQLLLTLLSKTVTNANFPGTGNGAVISPGVYNTSLAVGVAGTVKLDGGGNPNAVFIFVIDGALTVSGGASLLLVNGANAANVFFVVKAAINLLADCSLNGNFISTLGAVGVSAGVSIRGRVLSSNAAINISSTTLIKPTTVSQIPAGLLDLFVLFTGSGAIASTGLSNIIGDVGTNNGVAAGFELGTLNGSIYLPGKTSSVQSFCFYVNNIKIASSSRERMNVILKDVIILNEIVTIEAGESVEVRVLNSFGTSIVYNRNLSLIKVK